MARQHDSLMDPELETLLDKVDSKFSLITLAARRARQITAYYGHLGEGLGSAIPPQVTSTSRKPLSIAFEETAASKIVFVRREPEVVLAEVELEVAAAVEAVQAAEDADSVE